MKIFALEAESWIEDHWKHFQLVAIYSNRDAAEARKSELEAALPSKPDGEDDVPCGYRITEHEVDEPPVKLTLDADQIQSLQQFARTDGQAAYTITRACIPMQDNLPEYSGLIAYSSNENAGVLLLEPLKQVDQQIVG